MTRWWRVGFTRAVADSEWWQHRLLRPGFAHCWATRRLWRGTWLWLEWGPGGIVAGTASAAMVRRASRRAANLMAFPYDPDAPARGRARPGFAIFQCATLTAHLIGLRVRPFASPWAVACAAEKRGGVWLKRSP